MQQSAHSFWRFFASVTLAAGFLFSGAVGHAQSAEYQQKAAVIMGIVRATDWPVAKLKTGAPIVIGVHGPELAADKLREAVAGRTFNGRAVVVKTITAVQEIEGCHVVFVSAADDDTTRSILRRTSGDPILTFGETPAFADKGGIFILQSARSEGGMVAVRTLLDGKNLRRSKLKIDDDALIAARVEPSNRR